MLFKKYSCRRREGMPSRQALFCTVLKIHMLYFVIVFKAGLIWLSSESSASHVQPVGTLVVLSFSSMQTVDHECLTNVINKIQWSSECLNPSINLLHDSAGGKKQTLCSFETTSKKKHMYVICLLGGVQAMIVWDLQNPETKKKDLWIWTWKSRASRHLI